MQQFLVTGGQALQGEVSISGAKNAALPILFASLLSEKPTTISNVPKLKDIETTVKLLQLFGAEVSFSDNIVRVDAGKVANQFAPYELVKTMRASILALGPLLSRFGQAEVSLPGGCAIGARPVNLHIDGLRKMGAEISVENGYIKAKAERLQGAHIVMDMVSVTGTENLLMAAVLANGVTIIENAAREPEVVDLATYLSAMGAKITGVGSNLLTIEGVETLGGCEHRILPDMVEIGSWIGLAAMTRSEITIKNVSWDNLGQIPNVFRKLGITLERRGEDIYIPAHKDGYEIKTDIDGSILTVSDAPWPGFTPDLLSIVLVVCTQAKGDVLIHQKMFESRLFFVDKLIDMGAKIMLCDPHRAVVMGHNFQSQLKATTMSSPDIRAGISLLIAALTAKGTSTIQNIEQIDRGYERIDERLRAIGANIVRV